MEEPTHVSREDKNFSCFHSMSRLTCIPMTMLSLVSEHIGYIDSQKISLQKMVIQVLSSPKGKSSWKFPKPLENIAVFCDTVPAHRKERSKPVTALHASCLIGRAERSEPLTITAKTKASHMSCTSPTPSQSIKGNVVFIYWTRAPRLIISISITIL